MWPIWEEEKRATDQSWFPAQPVALAPVQPVDVDQAENVNCVKVGSVINSEPSTMYEQTCTFISSTKPIKVANANDDSQRRQWYQSGRQWQIRAHLAGDSKRNSVFPTCIVGTHIFEEKKDNGWQLHLPSMMALFSSSTLFTWSLSFSSTSLWGVLCRRAAFCLSRARTCVSRNEQSFWAFEENPGNFWAFEETPGNSWKLLQQLGTCLFLKFCELVRVPVMVLVVVAGVVGRLVADHRRRPPAHPCLWSPHLKEAIKWSVRDLILQIIITNCPAMTMYHLIRLANSTFVLWLRIDLIVCVFIVHCTCTCMLLQLRNMWNQSKNPFCSHSSSSILRLL